MAFSKIAAENLGGSTLPAIGGGNLTGISAGITNCTQFSLQSNFSGDANPISSNWETVDSDGYSTLDGATHSEFTNSSSIRFIMTYQT